MGGYREKVIRAGVRNGNGRVYPLELLQEAVDRFMEDLKGKGHPRFGELGMPDGFDVSLSRASHTLDRLSIDGEGYVVAEGRFLKNENGKAAEELWRQGIAKMRTRGAGETKPDGTVSRLKIFTVDLTGEPSDLESESQLPAPDRAC